MTKHGLSPPEKLLFETLIRAARMALAGLERYAKSKWTSDVEQENVGTE